MKKMLKIMGGFLVISVLVSGCQMFFVDTESLIATKVAEVVDARMMEYMESVESKDDVPAAETEEPTPYPTYTPYPTQETKTIYYNYGSAIGTPGGCLNAAFVSETIADGTNFDPGDGFIKSWTIKNTGYCTWNTNYKLVFYSGYRMGGDASTSLPQSVAPGQTVTLKAHLTAPSSEGTYRGEWRVKSDLGVIFARFWVEIDVN